MTGPLLNYSAQSNQLLVAVPQAQYGFTGNGVIAKLPGEHFNRYINRMMLITTLAPSDRGFPTLWGVSGTVDFYVSQGAPGIANNIVDFTHFGDLNIAEYAIPILVPKDTEFFFLWNDVLAASSSKCRIILGLTT